MTMEKISNIISKKVISLEDASQVGYVIDVVFDEKVKFFTGLIIVDDESENSFVLKKEDIYSSGEDTVMIKSSSCLQFNIQSSTNNPVGKTVYDSHGTCLGKVIDVELQGKQVKKLVTTFCEFPQKYVRKSGENFLIFGTQVKEKEKTFKEKTNTINSSQLPKVAISPIIDNKSVVVSNLSPESPTRVFANPKLLIGRVVTNEILGYNNELIAQKNDLINQKIINKAKLHNKLSILNYYSK